MDSIQNLVLRRENAADHIKDTPTTPQYVYDLLVDNPIMLGWLLLLTALCLGKFSFPSTTTPQLLSFALFFSSHHFFFTSFLTSNC